MFMGVMTNLDLVLSEFVVQKGSIDQRLKESVLCQCLILNKIGKHSPLYLLLYPFQLLKIYYFKSYMIVFLFC